MDEEKGNKLAYSIKAAADAVDLGRSRIYDLISEGKIEAKSCGRRTLIPAASLQKFLDSLPQAQIKPQGSAKHSLSNAE